MEEQTRIVTQLELVKSQQRLKDEMTGEIKQVDDKVDDLRSIVLPLVETSKQTADNTKNISDAINDFTKEQRKTNSNMWNKLNDHDVSLAEIGITSKTKSDTWKANAQIIVAVIGIIGLIITGIFNIAPLFFQ